MATVQERIRAIPNREQLDTFLRPMSLAEAPMRQQRCHSCVLGMACLLCLAISMNARAEGPNPIKATLDCGQQASHQASALLLGHNIETGLDTVPGLLSDRLDNPKFLGPADSITGIAPGWRHNSDNMNEVRCELTPGSGMSGNSAQLIQNFNAEQAFGILQNNRKIRAGETYEVEIWARAWNHPVTLCVGLLPPAATLPPYSEAQVEVDASYFKQYQVSLTSPVDTDEAAFSCALKGQGAVWIDQIHLRKSGEGLLCKELIEKFDSLDIPVLRFPGGVVTTAYRWRFGTGPVELRPSMPDPVCKKQMDYDFGTDEFLELCHQQNILPYITVNVGFGTPQEAGEWAAYCTEWYTKRNAPVPTIYFQIANHPYLTVEFTNMTPDMYVQTLRVYAAEIRKNCPTARIVAVTDPAKTEWHKAVLAAAADAYDVLALQGYSCQPTQLAYKISNVPSTMSDETSMENVAQGVDALSGILAGAIEDCKQQRPSTRVGLVEWNLWAVASHRDGKNFTEPYDVQHGLFVGSMIHEFVRLAPELELANFYSLLNPMGMFIHRGPEVIETCLAEVFRAYRPAFPGDVLPVRLESPQMGKSLVLDSVLLENAGGMWLFVVNRHASSPVELDVTGLALAGAEVYSLVGQSAEGEFERVEAAGAGNQLILPPLSITRVHVPASNSGM